MDEQNDVIQANVRELNNDDDSMIIYSQFK